MTSNYTAEIDREIEKRRQQNGGQLPTWSRRRDARAAVRNQRLAHEQPNLAPTKVRIRARLARADPGDGRVSIAAAEIIAHLDHDTQRDVLGDAKRSR